MLIGVAEFAGDPERRRKDLAQVGISEETLLDALGLGLSERARATSSHPKMAPGMYMYMATVAALGELTKENGWRREDYKGFATIRRPDDRVAIAVASGTEGTGDLAAEVTTRSPKGVATEEAVDLNLKLPYDERYIADNARIRTRQPANEQGTVTWFLLHDIRGGILYSELSRPMAISEGYVVEWAPRIPLTPRPLDPEKVSGPTDAPVEPTVQVRRRDL